MISEISCAERIFFEDEFPVIVVQLVELSYNVSRGDWLPALQIRPFWNSGGGFYLWTRSILGLEVSGNAANSSRLFFLDVE